MSIMRTYYMWQLAESSDKSYMIAVFGLWSDAELSVGVLIGCFPVIPRFLQFVGPKISQAIRSRAKPARDLGQNLGNKSKTNNINTLTVIKNPFAKYKVGLSIVDSGLDPHANIHGEYYIMNGSEASHSQETTAFAQIQVPNAQVATKREDLEYGSQTS